MPLFVDTNVFVYARDRRDPVKHARATEWVSYLWETGAGRVSTQVLQEFYVTMTRKIPRPVDPELARGDVLDLATWGPITIDPPLLGRAWSLEDVWRASFWDALILAAAQEAGCDVLLTEDLQHGSVIDGVRVANPFETPVPEG